MEFLIFKKPVTPGLRHKVQFKNTLISKRKRLKKKSFQLKSHAGRNHSGQLSIFTKGGGHKRLYRNILFFRPHLSGIIESIEYDPYRSANIARVYSSNKEHLYILAPLGLKRGDYIQGLEGRSLFEGLKVGNVFFLKDLPLGSVIHNIFFPNTKRSGVARAAGTFGIILSRSKNWCRVKLPSGEHRLLPANVLCCLGQVSNVLKYKQVIGKAGCSRWMNKRPKVRGVAMNPVDHPHGGGEGRTSGGRPSVSPWGKITKGVPTRKRKSSMILQKRKK